MTQQDDQPKWPPEPDENGYFTWQGRLYKTNGCTGVPDGDWLDCCSEHDHKYVRGGSMWDRFKADWLLGHCIYCIGRRKGWLWAAPYAFVGIVYFCGTRVFGFCLWRWVWK